MDEPRKIDFARIAAESGLTVEQVTNVADLLDEGHTVPFITRYRKERTGNLDEVVLREIQHLIKFRRQLAERAEAILRLIDSQNKLTPKLRAAVEGAETLKRLEDLYLPYKPKRKSRATTARQRGLEPLADGLWNENSEIVNLEEAATQYVDSEKELPDISAVLQGAADILAERIGENADVRDNTRKVAWKTGRLKVTVTKSGTENEQGQEFRDYFDFSESVGRVPPHRIMALNRGEKNGVLRVRLEWDEKRARSAITKTLKLDEHRFSSFLENCAGDALNRLIQPSLEREVRRELTSRAEKHAVDVFARNLRSLLLQPPLGAQRILAIDPGFRTGCKLALLDELGNCQETGVLYVTGSAEKKTAEGKKLAELLERHECTLVAIGNGTACRETEELVSEMISQNSSDVRYVIVNEAGASIYSASAVAGEEFPDFDATVRGTISIGRRLQDPLSELVKIDPQHIGVGMYQHDVNPRMLEDSLEETVESCVNYVGVDLNIASASLLRRVSGLNQLIARRVVEWREQNGRFSNRRQLMEVAGIGEATFTQAAGFLKIAGGDEPLDGTWIHPESYDAAGRLLERLSISRKDLIDGSWKLPEVREHFKQLDVSALAEEMNVGLPTFQDIVAALSRPQRDPRTDLPGPIFKQGILKLDDLAEGMELMGTVLNVVDFGVFVDIGLKDSGLVHISELSTRFVRNPHDLVSVGDVTAVWVLGIDRDRRRISLSMIKPGTPRETKPEEPSPQKRTEKTRQKRQTDNGTSTEKKPVTTGGQKKQKQETPAPPLTPEMIEGSQPLRGFGELKELWKNRDES